MTRSLEDNIALLDSSIKQLDAVKQMVAPRNLVAIGAIGLVQVTLRWVSQSLSERVRKDEN